MQATNSCAHHDETAFEHFRAHRAMRHIVFPILAILVTSCATTPPVQTFEELKNQHVDELVRYFEYVIENDSYMSREIPDPSHDLYPNAYDYQRRALALASADPASESAFLALAWAFELGGGGQYSQRLIKREIRRAARILIDHHITRPDVAWVGLVNHDPEFVAALSEHNRTPDTIARIVLTQAMGVAGTLGKIEREMALTGVDPETIRTHPEVVERVQFVDRALSLLIEKYPQAVPLHNNSPAYLDEEAGLPEDLMERLYEYRRDVHKRKTGEDWPANKPFYADWQPSYAGDLARKILHRQRTLRVGKTLPDIQAPGLDGAMHSLSEYAGEIVVIHTWETGLGIFTIQDLPKWQEFAARHHGHGVRLLGINFDDSTSRVERFLAVNEVPCDHWLSEPPDRITGFWGVQGSPAQLVLDRRGRLRVVLDGSGRVDVITKFVELLLRETDRSTNVT